MIEILHFNRFNRFFIHSLMKYFSSPCSYLQDFNFVRNMLTNSIRLFIQNSLKRSTGSGVLVIRLVLGRWAILTWRIWTTRYVHCISSKCKKRISQNVSWFVWSLNTVYDMFKTLRLKIEEWKSFKNTFLKDLLICNLSLCPSKPFIPLMQLW